ncbi:glycosyltransferase [Rhodopirellula sallentina]|nr:glycosyltransferase [Rhodopirellula sallentina]
MSQNLQPFADSERRSVRWGRSRLRLEVLRVLQGRSLSKAAGRIFLTGFALDLIRSQFPIPDIGNREIPHGVDKCFFVDRPSFKDAANPHGDYRIVYVSTINGYKHQLEVVEAVSRLAERWPSLSLSLVGGVYDETYYENVLSRIRAANGNAGREIVRHVGKVSFDELPKVYREADMSVFASSCENLPNILLESMAASLPIVASTYSPMPQVLGDSGVYCDVSSASSIADAIESYLVSPELCRKNAVAANRAASGYSWARTSDMTFQFLASVARDHSSQCASCQAIE